MFNISTKQIIQGITVISAITIGWQTAGATVIDKFTEDGWIQFADDEGIVGPGGGGQAFDAEYLFYKKEGSTLSIGLQTGFNVVDGKQTYSNHRYDAGDLALSFDGDNSTYEYAFDAGQHTEGYWNNTDNTTIETVEAGLYLVTEWNNDVYAGYTESNPFAMQTGTVVHSVTDGALTNALQVGDSYWRTFSFDLAELALSDPNFNFAGIDAHWTMSCGNDNINGSAPVPEPATMLLFGTGLAGLAGYRKKRVHKKYS